MEIIEEIQVKYIKPGEQHAIGAVCLLKHSHYTRRKEFLCRIFLNFCVFIDNVVTTSECTHISSYPLSFPDLIQINIYYFMFYKLNTMFF